MGGLQQPCQQDHKLKNFGSLCLVDHNPVVTLLFALEVISLEMSVYNDVWCVRIIQHI